LGFGDPSFSPIVFVNFASESSVVVDPIAFFGVGPVAVAVAVA